MYKVQGNFAICLNAFRFYRSNQMSEKNIAPLLYLHSTTTFSRKVKNWL